MPRSPARAIAWEFRRRHRWGLIALAGYLLVLGTIKLVTVARGLPSHPDSPERLAFVVLVPLATTFVYLLAVFSFGLTGDLAARHSMYPARMFTLPVTTAALAGWPMLYGSVAMAILWLATRLLAVWPSDMDVPVIWPAVLAASMLAWTQALTWMPYGLPGLRVILSVLWLTVIDGVVLVAIQYKVPETVMVAILAPQVPLACLAARFAVARARRGDMPDWRGRIARRARISTRASSARAPFLSAARAQAWFEWKRHGLTLPAWVAIVLPFELALLWIAGDGTALVFAILIGAGLTPPLMAAFAATTVRKSNPDARDSLGVSPFIATRSLTNAALIAAKLKAAMWSTMAAWLVVLIAIPIALRWSDTWPVVADRSRRLAEIVGTPRAVVLLLLGLAGLIASTWKQLVQTLWVGLTGRAWIVNASIVLALLVVCAIGPILIWIAENGRVQDALYDRVPLILTLLVGCKMAVAFWVVTRLHRGRVLGDRALVTGAAVWLVAVVALYALLGWLISGPLVPRYLLGLVAILAVPLARLSAAPLALAWNRHR